MTNQIPHVVIIGGGFGGLAAARALKSAPVRITLLDRANHHLFQPLLYQVAIAGLSPADIAAPIRSILRSQKNVTVLLGEAVNIELDKQFVELSDGQLSYDYLIIATGGRTSYFGNDAWEKFAPGMKSIDDALEIRRRVLLSFELAEKETDLKKREELMRMSIKTDPHSPAMFRVNVPLMNFEPFYQAFNVKEGDKMYLKPEDRAKIW